RPSPSHRLAGGPFQLLLGSSSAIAPLEQLQSRMCRATVRCAIWCTTAHNTAQCKSDTALPVPRINARAGCSPALTSYHGDDPAGPLAEARCGEFKQTGAAARVVVASRA